MPPSPTPPELPRSRGIAMGICALFAFASVATFSVRGEAQAVRRVQFFGDSITANLGLQPQHQYPTLVGRRLRDVIVQNLGVPGGTMTDAGAIKGWASHKATLSAVAGIYQPGAIVILLGTNDWFRARGVQAFENAYRQFVLAAPGNAQIICITPLWRADEGANAVGDTLEDYRAAVRAACARHTVVDGLEAIPADERYFLDGLHPSKTGNRRLARVVAATLDQQ